MPEITLRNITKRWGKFFGVDHLDLDIADNSFITLLGPSGCGKTTILRMIAGLETPTTGQIKIGDKVVFDSEAGINIPANKRKVGFLFQNYALWPNMTVYQNISFGLSNIKEELPKYDFDAMTTGELIRALKSGKKIKELVEECRDKRGKLDTDKVYLKFIDAFILSIYTAKILYGYGIQDAADPDAAAKAKAEELKNSKAEIETIFYEWLLAELPEDERNRFCETLDKLYLRSKNERRAGFETVSKLVAERQKEGKETESGDF